MNKVNVINVLFISITFVLFFLFFKKNPEEIDCNGELVVFRDDGQMHISISQKMKDGDGVVMISGSILHDGRKTFVGKNVSFTYQNSDDSFSMKSISIQDSPNMKLSRDDQARWFPQFFLVKDSQLNVRVQKINGNIWEIYSRVVPMYICKKPGK